MTDGLVDLSVVIPAANEAENLALLLPELDEELRSLGIRYETLVITPPGDIATARVARSFGATALEQGERGYGGALIAGFRRASGRFVLTMDADLSHRPIVARDLWSARHQGQIVIASRYTGGGSASMPLGRRLLSEVLNLVFSRVLGLSARDTSSGYRLYDARALHPERLQGRDFDILQEILVQAAVAGWRVREIPFGYEARRYGRSHARVLRLGMAYARTLWYLYRLRRASDTGRVPDGKPASTYWRDVSR